MQYPRDPKEMAQQLAVLRGEQASEAMTKASENLSAQLSSVAKMQIDFFDRLIILDGGTITLSLTIIGMLVKAGKPLANDTQLLFASWGLFVVSLISAILRNWKEPERLATAEHTNFTYAVTENFAAMKAQAELLGVTEPPGQDIVAQGQAAVKRQYGSVTALNKFTGWTGGIALWSTVLGYILLVWFVACNAKGLLTP